MPTPEIDEENGSTVWVSVSFSRHPDFLLQTLPDYRIRKFIKAASTAAKKFQDETLYRQQKFRNET
ncbi:MAG: hypothetical protein BroJett015_06430 [Chloroflexota bacterium]|nr:MAG: hypothetical protein BroJett015_06430 [Chloroflexota bacterium]